MKKVQFVGEILAGHKKAAIQVPFDPAQQWGIATSPLLPGRRGFKVTGTLAGVAFASAIVARSKKFWVLIEPEHLKSAQLAVGASAKVTLQPTDA